MEQTLLNDWTAASLARENGDSDFAKTQALLTGRIFLAMAELPVGTPWELIPDAAKDEATSLLRDLAKHDGFAISKGEIRKQARSVIDRNMRLPETLAYKVIFESYGKDEEATAQRQQKLEQLLRIADGEYIPTIPDRIHRRIARRVRLNRRYLVAATDLRESLGRPGYVKDSGPTAREQQEWIESDPERADDIVATTEWWDAFVRARMYTRRAFEMIAGNEQVHPNQVSLVAAQENADNANAIVAILSAREVWDQQGATVA